jgi:phosphomannomutase
VLARLRAAPPRRLAGFDVTATDLLARRGQQRTDALIFAGGDERSSVRLAVRPSGTEPKIKCYIEIRQSVDGDLAAARAAAAATKAAVETEAAEFLQRGPN